MATYTKKLLQSDGMEPAFQMLLRGAPSGRRVTYGSVAAHLQQRLGIPKVFSTHIGGVAGALMDEIRVVEPDAPLINMLVVNGGDWEPGVGGDSYLRDRFGISKRELAKRREVYVQEAINEVRAYTGWPDVYRKLFKGELVPDATLNTDDYDEDGQPDNPVHGRGGPESEEHKRLKAFVRDNPQLVGIKGIIARARLEARLLSGDEMDVELLVGSMRWGVEVKSSRSGDADLERGIYQCIKYRAVMIAESGFDADEAECDALLVTERPLPTALRSLAKRLAVRHVCVDVKP